MVSPWRSATIVTRREDARQPPHYVRRRGAHGSASGERTGVLACERFPHDRTVESGDFRAGSQRDCGGHAGGLPHGHGRGGDAQWNRAALRVAEWQRPATSRLLTPCGTSVAKGNVVRLGLEFLGSEVVGAAHDGLVGVNVHVPAARGHGVVEAAQRAGGRPR